MQFATSRSIYEQIVDYVGRQILHHKWNEDDRLPSVRELAVRLEVNPNTVQRAYSQLQEAGLIQNQRGVGYFVADGARNEALTDRRSTFVEHEIPRLSEEMDLLELDFTELEAMIRSYREENR